MAKRMDKHDWWKIQKNWDYLKKELDPSPEFLDELRSSSEEVLTEEDYERIRYEKVKADKTERLLRILKFKPQKLCAYKFFLDVLRKLQNHICECLNATEVGDENVSDEDEQTLDIDSCLRDILLRNFQNEEGKRSWISDVRECLLALRGRGLYCDWEDDRLKEFVVDVFTDVIPERKKKKRKKLWIFVNLGAKKGTPAKMCPLIQEEDSSEARSEGSNTTVSEISVKQKPLEEMTEEDVALLMAPIFQKLGLGETFQEEFREKQINGQALFLVTESHLKEEFSSVDLPLGKRLILMKEIKELQEKKDICLSCPVVTKSSQETKTFPKENLIKEHLRRFDMPVAPTDKYRRGGLIETTGFSRENKINPVKMFLSFGEEETDLYERIARETVKFGSACMNDRANGTLYVGIDQISMDDNQQGQVVGIQLDKFKCEDIIRQKIADAFYEDQHDIAFQAIRSTKFIEVVDPVLTNCWVVEIDVVPEVELVKEEAFFVRGKILQKETNYNLFRVLNGELKAMSEKEIFGFMEERQQLSRIRKQQELKASDSSSGTDLRTKLLNLFTGGSETVEDELYPVVFTSPLDTHMNAEFIRENLSFIQYLDAKIFFDFDSKSDKKGLYWHLANECKQVYEVYVTENFDKAAKEYSSRYLEGLKMSQNQSWMLCNGYQLLGKQEMNAFDWKQKRSDGFKEALKLFHSDIPQGRGLAVIFLFSKNYNALLEAADEVVMKFKDQWMLFAETQEIADSWQSELVRRNVASKNSLDSRCIIGMPWKHVSSTFRQIINPKEAAACQLPTYTGALCTLSERERSDMKDLDILSSKECDFEDSLKDKESRETVRRKVEEKFFRGGQAEWINFWFRSDHVLQRKQHKLLKTKVESALAKANNDDDEWVNVVTLMHHPGAGGTTTAKQILWDLRENFRCCIVRRISEETVSQITKLRNIHEGSSRKPPLILLDNEDDEKVLQLILQLEYNAKLAFRNDERFDVYCVILKCVRRVNFPVSNEREMIVLKHELQTWELNWFQRKYEHLERKFNEDRKVDPKLLITFNILKSNFEPEYIKRTVRIFMAEISDTEEETLLCYLSLLNSYDTDFLTIPVSAFDPLLQRPIKEKRILQFGLYETSSSRAKGWETSMSTSLRVLINESAQRGAQGTQLKTIRITSPLLAKEILAYFLQKNNNTLSCILGDLMHSHIFDCENFSTAKVMTIVKNLVKRRMKQKDGKLAQFSPFIMQIMKDEGADKTADVFVHIYQSSEDPMIAQQIARFYIYTKNWREAERYASISIRDRPKRSFLWDTYGQVFYRQLVECNRNADIGRTINHSDAKRILHIAQRAINVFKKEQELSETEKCRNHGAYFGELRTTFVLLNTMCHFDSYRDGEDLHNFLVDKNYTSDAFSFLDKDEIDMVKSLAKSVFRTIRKLEDELVQMKSDSREEPRHEWVNDNKSLMILKENLNTYFGEESNEVPEVLSVEDACEYRRRRVKKMGVTSLQGALALKDKKHGTSELWTVFKLMKANIDSKFCSAFDLVTVLNTVIALHVAKSLVSRNIPYENILEWSLRLYDSKQPEERHYLETYLYLVIFHLPTEARRTAMFHLCTEIKLKEALRKWHDAFCHNYPKERDTERLAKGKDTTLFFLGKGIGFEEVVYQKELMVGCKKMRDYEFWQSDQAKQRFQRLEGVLLVRGLEVHFQMTLPGGNQFSLSIPTSLPILKRDMWQKKVFFVLGFSWSGPKAYDITLDNPSSHHALDHQHVEVPRSSMSGEQDHFTLILDDMNKELSAIEEKLEALSRKDHLSKKVSDKQLKSQFDYYLDRVNYEQFPHQQDLFIEQNIQVLLDKQAIHRVDLAIDGPGFYSRIFLMSKRDSTKYRMIHNLKWFNSIWFLDQASKFEGNDCFVRLSFP